MLRSLTLLALGSLTFACAQPELPETAPPAREGCAADHPRVGAEGALVSRAHGVMGTVRVVDECTLELTDFHFDGGGVDVRAIVSPNGDYANGVVLTEDLRRAGGYAGEVLRLNLPEGITLDDVGGLSIWCVPFGADFGSVEL